MDDLFTVSEIARRRSRNRAMICTLSALRKHCRLLAVLSLMLGCAAVSQAMADQLILQGSTTFNRRGMEPPQTEIQAEAGPHITLIPHPPMLGITALMGRP